MQIYNEDGQMSLFDQDSWSGKMYRGRSPPGSRKAKTSGSSSRRSSVSSVMPYMFLDLTPGHGDLLGLPYWQTIYPLPGECWTLNTGECPNDVVESSLSQILQDDPPHKYFLSRKACLGILRRAFERLKELPARLKRALQIQAGLIRPDGRPTPLEAYHINQRDEGIDLNGISGALMATSNMQMQTFVTQPSNGETVAGFCAGASPTAGNIGYQEECSPTLKAAESGTNMVPSILCLNDQGGSVMDCTENMTGTLRAQEHGHQPLVYENHGIDSRYTGPHAVAPTMSARYGTGGNNLPLVEEEPVFCITGNVIDRQPQNGENGIGYQEDLAYTLTATDHHAVFSRQRVDEFKSDDVVSTQSARQHKDATDLVFEVYGQSQFGNYSPGCTTLRAQGGDNGGGSENLITVDVDEFDNTPCALLIRRLTPLEWERLQGFPDTWTDAGSSADSGRYKALGNSVAIPCVEYIMEGIAAVYK